MNTKFAPEVASLPALWRLREDNGEEHTEFDKGYEQASDECARMLEAALAQQTAAEPTNEAVAEFRRFLNGKQPVDGKITMKQARHILREWPGQQPAAVDDAMVERAFNAWCDVAEVDEWRVRNTREAITAALTAALAQQPAAVDEAMERVRRGPDRLWQADLVGGKISLDRMHEILTAALAAVAENRPFEIPTTMSKAVDAFNEAYAKVLDEGEDADDTILADARATEAGIRAALKTLGVQQVFL